MKVKRAGNVYEIACSWPLGYHSARARQGMAFSAMSVAAFGQ